MRTLPQRRHDPQFVFQTEQGAEDIGNFEHRSIRLSGHAGHRTLTAFGASVVNGHIETTKARHRCADRDRRHLSACRISGKNEPGLRTQPAQLGFQRLPFRLPAARDNQPGPFLREGDGGCAADAGQGSGYQKQVLACSSLGSSEDMPRPQPGPGWKIRGRCHLFKVRQRFRREDRSAIWSGAFSQDLVSWRAQHLPGMGQRHGTSASSLFCRHRRDGQP